MNKDDIQDLIKRSLELNNEQDKISKFKKENISLRKQNEELKRHNNELLEEIIKLKYTKRNYERKSIEETNKQKEYKEFRQSILKRDNYRCQSCGSKEKLQVHHIKSRKEHPELIMNEDNCITLCIACHAKTDNYFS